MKYLLSFHFLLYSFMIFGQNLIDFENYLPTLDTFDNGKFIKDDFIFDFVSLQTNYDQDWNSWLGWSISNKVDNKTPGFTNQYSSIVGSGAEESSTYAIAYNPIPVYINVDAEKAPMGIKGFYMTNSTYAALSMKDGDSFAKKFGGTSGNDPDYYYIKIQAFFENKEVAEPIDVYLADFRFDDNSKDYILTEWLWIDISAFGKVDSLVFSPYSSDEGLFGINTPTYFCLDQIKALDVSSQQEINREDITFYPNPTTGLFKVDNESVKKVFITDESGKSSILELVHEAFDISDMKTGIYFIQFSDEQNKGMPVKKQKLIKL